MNILFLCTHNACRSILAEVIARDLGAARLQVFSAGSAPSGRVHPLTLQQLQARGYSTANLHSKSWDALQAIPMDLVITVCDRAAGETCPAWFGEAVKLHWGLPDPTHPAHASAETDTIDSDTPYTSTINTNSPAASTLDTDALFDQVITTLQRRVQALLALDLDQPLAQLSPALQALAQIN